MKTLIKPCFPPFQNITPNKSIVADWFFSLENFTLLNSIIFKYFGKYQIYSTFLIFFFASQSKYLFLRTSQILKFYRIFSNPKSPKFDVYDNGFAQSYLFLEGFYLALGFFLNWDIGGFCFPGNAWICVSMCLRIPFRFCLRCITYLRQKSRQKFFAISFFAFFWTLDFFFDVGDGVWWGGGHICLPTLK